MHIFITFRRKLEGKTNRTVLEDFMRNFEKSNCDHVEIIDDRTLVVKNDFFRFRSRNNIWSYIRYAEVLIQDSIKLGAKEVLYKIDILRFLIVVIGVLIFAIIANISRVYFLSMSGIILFVFIVFFIAFIILFFSHRFLFSRIMKYGGNITDNKGKYDWSEILKTKTDRELKEIYYGRSTLTEAVSELAKIELERRNIKL
jgi:hypothetical protein